MFGPEMFWREIPPCLHDYHVFHLKLNGEVTTHYGRQPEIEVEVNANFVGNWKGRWQISPYLFDLTEDLFKKLETHNSKTHAPTWKPLRRYGEILFETMMGVGSVVEDIWREAINTANTEGFTIRFLLECSPYRLANIPWELVFDSLNVGFIALRCHFIRYIPTPYRWVSAEHSSIERLLAVQADYDTEIENDYETKIYKKYWSRLFQEVSILSHPATDQIVKEIRQKEPDIFHYTGHSSLVSRTGEFRYAPDVEGILDLKPAPLTSRELAKLLGFCSTEIVVLNSCLSGQFQRNSFIDALARSGIPNILAMNQRALHTAAHFLAKSFYQHLALGKTLEQALTEARRNAFQNLHNRPSLEWGLPVAMFHTPQLKFKQNGKSIGKEGKDNE